MNTSRSEGPTERRASLVNVNNDKSYSQECDDLQNEEQYNGATAVPYLVIAVLAALAGIAFWLLS